MSALGEGRIRMVAHQTNITFPSVTIVSPDRAEVKTEESWDYSHVNIDTSDITSKKSVEYGLNYSLVREDDHWLVSDISVESEREIK